MTPDSVSNSSGHASPANSAALLARVEDLERMLGQVKKELDHAQRLATLGTIAGSIAHEFNNILTPLLSYAQMALSDSEDSELVQKALHKAVDGAERASRIASAMLGFVHYEDDEGGASVAACVQAALECLGRDPSRDGVRIVTQGLERQKVEMRPVCLQQVFMNLILNAIEAMRPAGGTLTVRAVEKGTPAEAMGHCSTWNNSQPLIGIEVSDSGPGVPADLIRKVFSPFVTRKRDAGERKGTGLGLAICKRLVEEAGGSIGVENGVGGGACVRFWLPRAEEAAHGDETSRAA